MNSLETEIVQNTLEALHRAADETDSSLLAEMTAQMESSGETMEAATAQLLANEKADYAAVYRDHADRYLSISANYGRFLYAIARARNATRIVEFGTSMGVSTIYLAAALRDNGGGRLIGSDLEASKVTHARANLAMAGLSDLVEFLQGDALTTFKGIGEKIDVLLLDGAFSLYLPILKLVEPWLASGAVILGENAFDPDYLSYVRDPANGYISQSLPIDEGRGNEFTVRVMSNA